MSSRSPSSKALQRLVFARLLFLVTLWPRSHGIKLASSKEDVPAFSVPQVPEAVEVLIDHATEIDVHLRFADVNPFIDYVQIVPNAD